MTLFPGRPFKHRDSDSFAVPVFEENHLEFDPPVDEEPESVTNFEGAGPRFGFDRDNMLSVHGDSSGGFPIKPVEQTRG